MDRSLPPYTHIPGVTPHPIRDPAGHSYEAPKSLAEILISPPVREALTSENLPLQPEFLWAVQLFNAGYYWEAHEAWESLWHRAGRSGVLADYLKGLIKLAAAGVKLREHNASGVERHSQRALELFQSVADRLTADRALPDHERELAQTLERLIALAERLNHQPPVFPGDRSGRPVAALPRLAHSILRVTEP